MKNINYEVLYKEAIYKTFDGAKTSAILPWANCVPSAVSNPRDSQYRSDLQFLSSQLSN